MNYLEGVADAILSGVPSELLPDLDTTDLFRIYAVLALAKGDGVALEDVHNAWSAWMSGQDPRHQAIRPLAELSADVQVAERTSAMATRSVSAGCTSTRLHRYRVSPDRAERQPRDGRRPLR